MLWVPNLYYLAYKKGELQEIEEICEKPMEALGYAKFDPKITEDQEMLTKSADEIWPYFSFEPPQLQDFKGLSEEELSNVMNGKSKLPWADYAAGSICWSLQIIKLTLEQLCYQP